MIRKRLQLSNRASVRLAIALAVVYALTNARLLLRAVKNHRGAPGGSINEVFVARLEPLKASLPSWGTLGYLSQSSPDCDLRIVNNRLHLMRYAVVPCLLDNDQIHDLVLFDADDAQATPAQAGQDGWQLVADAGNGLKLYRTSRPK